jgi:hypothetical protein
MIKESSDLMGSVQARKSSTSSSMKNPTHTLLLYPPLAGIFDEGESEVG